MVSLCGRGRVISRCQVRSSALSQLGPRLEPGVGRVSGGVLQVDHGGSTLGAW